MRVTVAIDPQADRTAANVKTVVDTWLREKLREGAPDLQFSAEKMKVVSFGSGARPLVRQSTGMRRIQTAVSGGFDALGGEEILDGIQGLIRAQEEPSVAEASGWHLAPTPDVRDETVARFAAVRFRTTFRSIRPLLEAQGRTEEVDSEGIKNRPTERMRAARTRLELDEDARNFALGVIQRWVEDPSNVRLLRIGLDLWPDVEVLQEVLNLLRPFTEKRRRRKTQRRVAWYCLSEILRAGATETGFVADGDSLPAAVNLESYRKALGVEAARLVLLPPATVPWYLRQQALLFLAAFDPAGAPVTRMRTSAETWHYRELIRFLRGESRQLRSSEFATFSVLARRGFVSRERAIELTQPGLNLSRRRQIAARDPSFALELISADRHFFDDLTARTREDLSGAVQSPPSELDVLANIVLAEHPTGSLRNELGLLRFALAFLQQWRQEETPPEVITPGQVQLKKGIDEDISSIEELRILRGRADPSGSLYQTPEWCDESDRWRFHVGFLLRFILSGQPDFTRSVRAAYRKESESAYRPAASHWYLRHYGLFNGRAAFGDDWLPITDWMESLLLNLLRWPGFTRPTQGFEWVEQGIEQAIGMLEKRIDYLEQDRGSASGLLLLRLVAKRPTANPSLRSLCGCVVQTVIPTDEDFRADLTVSEPGIRTRHRNHLSAALAAVVRMLALRDTHRDNGQRLDWLILPELAVHPNDVRTHLIPFARAHRTMILAGHTYERIATGRPHFNSALWIIPEWSSAHGLQIRTLRQGKAHLSPDEQALNSDVHRLEGFRPCQWLVGYPWSGKKEAEPVWITASVCYDATDLRLAADLGGRSDVFAIPALNKDVKTFDQMALALHYHMFQLVVVANNGQYGGSNAYWPRSDPHFRQIFHSHGQPQASIAFFEIEDIENFLERRNQAALQSMQWKYPPAGLIPK